MSIKFNIELLRADLKERRSSKRISIATISRASGVASNVINILLFKDKSITMLTFVKLCNYLQTPPERYFKHDNSTL